MDKRVVETSGCVTARGAMEEPGTPRLAKYPLGHPRFRRILTLALPDNALAPSYTSLPVTDPRAKIFVATPLETSTGYISGCTIICMKMQVGTVSILKYGSDSLAPHLWCGMDTSCRLLQP